MKSKRYALVDRNLCVACGACTHECPKTAVTVHRGCYAQVEAESCIGCGKCAQVCPATAIVLRQREERNA